MQNYDIYFTLYSFEPHIRCDLKNATTTKKKNYETTRKIVKSVVKSRHKVNPPSVIP